MRGDALASGARSASYGNSSIEVTNKRWEEIFGKPTYQRRRKRSKKAK